ncbi:MAG: hypothetical protein ABW318_24205 [Vicinamibacterales bacterium]
MRAINRGSTDLWGFMAWIVTELYGETTVPKPGKIEAPHGPGLGLNPNHRRARQISSVTHGR